MIKYLEIAQIISERVKKGAYDAQGLPSEEELRTEACASRITIRKALGKLRDEGIINSLPGKGWVVTGSQAHRELLPNKKIKCLCNLRQPSTGIVISSLQRCAEKHGIELEYEFMDHLAGFDMTESEDARRSLEYKLSDEAGVLVIGVFSTWYQKSLSTLPVPVVFVGCESALTRYAVATDDYAGGWMAADYLLEAGCEAPLLVNWISPRDAAFERRRKGFRERMEEVGVSFKTVTTPFLGDDVKRVFAESPPTGLFFISDCVSPEYQRVHAATLGEKTLKKLFMIGIDNFVNNTSTPFVGYSSLAQPWEEIGEKAFYLLSDLIEQKEKIKPQKLLLRPQLINQEI